MGSILPAVAFAALMIAQFAAVVVVHHQNVADTYPTLPRVLTAYPANEFQ